MAYHPKQKLSGRARRKIRVRKKVSGSVARPRLSVFRSAKHIYAQVIDDDMGKTLVTASTVTKDVRGKVEGGKKDQAKRVGAELAKRCAEKNIKNVVFDRNGYRYHGRVKAVAEGAREAGLEF